MLNDVTQLEQEIKALEKEKEYFKDWCKVYESRIETKDHIIKQLETNNDTAINFIDQVLQYHITPFQPNELDEDINTLIGILRSGSNE